jgi:hypothetical protein
MYELEVLKIVIIMAIYFMNKFRNHIIIIQLYNQIHEFKILCD